MSKKANVPGRSLIDIVFSWSVQDVLNKDFFKGQVNTIPDTFASTEDYMNAFKSPLLEEVRTELCSGIKGSSQPPACQVTSVKTSKDFNLPNDFFYKITVKRATEAGSNSRGSAYEPEVGHLVALTDRPKGVADLNRPTYPCVLAYVHKVKNEGPLLELSILSSKLVTIEGNLNKSKQKETLFAIYLTNMTTNIRIWRSLNCELEGNNMNVIQKLLRANFEDSSDCTVCRSKRSVNHSISHMLKSSDLNESQKTAVLSCIKSIGCSHKTSLKLIWGPPGTGKTKTVGCLLYALLQMKCRTITCAPTNIAVLEAASRVLSISAKLSKYSTYGFGDIVLFGNVERMKIDEKSDLWEVFVDHRVDILEQCFSPYMGWNHSLASMICLLEDPEKEYLSYLKEFARVEHGDSSNKNCEPNANDNTIKKVLDKFEEQLLKNKNHQKPDDEAIQEQDVRCDPMKFNEFLLKRFPLVADKFKFCIENLSTHLPTSFITLRVVRKMFRAHVLIKHLEVLLVQAGISDESLKQSLNGGKGGGRMHDGCEKLYYVRKDCLNVLKSLPRQLQVPEFDNAYEIKQFCLVNASLVFCTASGSVKLHTPSMPPPHFLVVDEAAQLRECESTIPLQLKGVNHVVLIGDERQLPATVHSNMSGEAGLGRSLFERLSKLGFEKQLLNMQYRMHPSISFFPNREFYGQQILDAPNVKDSRYRRSILQGNMYGTYSFINMTHGKEESDECKSSRNMIEAAAVSDIVARLFKVYTQTKKKISIGVISPYKAQVRTLQEKLKIYSVDSDCTGFTVNLRSIDGFQGGEEDVIILSTVRCNTKGLIGFMSDLQRTNVALTRARYCLWVLGNEATLSRSHSIWARLINDAKGRGCFFDDDEDDSLGRAIGVALVELGQLDTLLSSNSVLFRKAKWKVIFEDEFRMSMKKMTNNETIKDVIAVLAKLSNGSLHQSGKKKKHNFHASPSQLIEQCRVNKQLNLVSTVDIQKEGCYEVQVLKVWDILPSNETERLALKLNLIYKSCTDEKMNRCQYKRIDRNVVVPMKWPVNTSDQLCTRFASLALTDGNGGSNTIQKGKEKAQQWRKKQAL